MQCPYVGLSNQGATCYMNSYLQHLYMNQNFRAILFSLNLKPNLQKNEQDSIPYQLQKLFCKLNLRINKMISTKDLTKSFQWTSVQTFQEHDINEFAKILFEAILQSLSNSSIKNQQNYQIFKNFLKRYDGVGINYLKCLNCSNKKISNEKFSEINLVIHNEFEKLRFKNLQMSLLNNIKPIILDQDNKVSCDKCGSKQDHEKGYQYQDFPDFLIFNLNRFVYDLQTFDRKKLDDYFEFPLILDLNSYLGNYDSVSQQTGINMKDAESIDFSQKQNDSTKKPVSLNNIIKTKKGKKFKNIKTSNKTRQFLKQMRKQKQQQKQYDDFVIFEPENQPEQKIQEESIDLKKSSQEGDSQQILLSENLNQDLNSQFSENILQLKKTKSKVEQPIKEYKKQESNSIQNDINQNLENITIQTKSDNNQNEKSKQEYKENQYALHSVFIHKGSAYSGHYYVYIKSFENKKWYLFDDYQVKEVQIADVLKDAFGGPQSSATAYNLFYQKIQKEQDSDKKIDTSDNQPRLRKKSFSDKHLQPQLDQKEEDKKLENKSQYFKIEDIINNTKCPEYMKKIIEQEMHEEEKKAKVNKVKRKRKVVRHRLHYKLKVQLVEVSIKKKFIDFEKICKEKLQIEEDDQNWRLRLYNRFKDEMLQSFEEKKDKTLEQLRLIAQKNFVVEIKETQESFEKYDPNTLDLQLVFWDQNCYQLDWKPQIQKIKISKNVKVKDLIDKIRTQYNNQLQKLKPDYSIEDKINLLIKKTFKNGLLRGEFISNQLQKSISDTPLSNQTILYVDLTENSNWFQFFESENNKIIIQFNYPAAEDYKQETKIEYGFKIRIDLNEKLKDFKIKIKQMFNLGEAQDFIIKKGGISGIELRDYSKQIRTLGIINNSFLYLQFGKAITIDEIKVNFFICLGELSQNYFNLERDIIFLKEIAINPNYRPQKVLQEIQSQLPPIYPFLIKSQNLKNSQDLFDKYEPNENDEIEKDKFNQIYTKEQKELDVQNQRYRLFEKVQQKIKSNKVLIDPQSTRIREKNGSILTKTYKDISMKHQGCVERKKLVLELFRNPLQNNEALIYWTFLDVQNFKFEPVKEIKIFKRATLKDLAEIILISKPELNLNQLEGTKIRDVREFMIEDILGHRFYDMNQNNILSTQPFYLESDGYLFIFKNKNETLSGKKKSFKKNPNLKFFQQKQENQLKIFVKDFDDNEIVDK